MHMATWESFIVVCNTIGATYFFIFYESYGLFIAQKLDFNLLSVAIVFPLTYLIGQTFTRREKALDTMADLRSFILNICLSCMLWDWGPYKEDSTGRDKLPENFNEEVTTNCMDLALHLAVYLTGANVTKTRYVTINPQVYIEGWNNQAEEMLIIDENIRKSYRLVEVMKSKGLPANEASRINQYHTLMRSRIEALRNIKWYRTPHGTRAFGRVYILLMPWAYGPYFAWVCGRNFDTVSTKPLAAGIVAFAFCLSILTSVVLIGLINVQRMMEDPFIENGIDNVRVKRDFSELNSSLQEAYLSTPGAKSLETLDSMLKRVEKSRLLKHQHLHCLSEAKVNNLTLNSKSQMFLKGHMINVMDVGLTDMFTNPPTPLTPVTVHATPPAVVEEKAVHVVLTGSERESDAVPFTVKDEGKDEVKYGTGSS